VKDVTCGPPYVRLLPEVMLCHNVNYRLVKRLPLVARLPPAFHIGPHAGWNYGIVTPFL